MFIFNLLLLPMFDLLQQFEGYVKGIALRKKQMLTNLYKEISWKICTKNGVNLKISLSNRSPEGLDWVTKYWVWSRCCSCVLIFPFEVLTDGNSQIFFLVNRFEDMTMKTIVEFHFHALFRFKFKRSLAIPSHVTVISGIVW